MTKSRLRAVASVASVFTAAAAVSLTAVAPASAHGDREHIDKMRSQ